MADRFCCSLTAQALGEPQWATASRVRRWVLLEEPGPWGRDAVLESPLDGGLALELRARARAAGARLLLIRRHGRYQPLRRTVLVAVTALEGSWLERCAIGAPAELRDLDWAALARDASVGGDPVDDAVYLVCTNGRHDACCAQFGRPLAKALSAAFGDQVWECSHFGGDRFAGNLVCLPDGVYYGRVTPADGPRLAAAYAARCLDLGHYRGRACLPFPVQAAEHLVREREGLVGLRDVGVRRWADAGPGRLAVTLAVQGRSETVTVEVTAAEPRRLTCHATAALAPPVYRLVDP